ncbi:MAG: ArsA-related P-loop ATPase, partial [Bacillota bacterium]|nr:ArsA-related P-loop ATPase [Bacillota bacterium]
TIRREKETEEDRILNELLYIRDRINKSSSILTDPQRTAFFFVVTPEEMVIEDTVKAAGLFSKYEVPIRGYVVNRVVPPALLEQDIPDYLRNRILMQKGNMERIRREFAGRILAEVPEMERDIRGMAMIEKMAGVLFGN